MNIKVLNKEEVRMIYDTHMQMDFPPQEVKPYGKMIQLMEMGRYECLGLYDEEQLCAYAFLVLNQEEMTLLLDYLAVPNMIRGSGYGSRMLKELRKWYEDWNGIYIESEALRTSEDDEQLKIRRRRLDFYQKNGAVLTRVKTEVFGTEYTIFYVPISGKAADHDQELEQIYQKMFLTEKSRNRVRAWNRSMRLNSVRRWDAQKKKLEESRSLMQALGISEVHPPKIIAFAGGGGKTSTMFQLADELAECGKKVLVTTTTHFQSLRPDTTAEISCLDELRDDMWPSDGILTVGRPAGQKLAMPIGMEKKDWRNAIPSCCDVVLLEADGAKRMAFKVPREGEPVYPAGTEMIIACVGLSVLGKTYREGCFRFEREGGWTGKDPDERITAQGIAEILMDERGSAKGLKAMQEDNSAVSYRILLNQADTDRDWEEAAQIIRHIRQEVQENCAVTQYFIV